MLKALNSGASGLNSQQLRLDSIAGNVANINTAGFKKSRAEFSELISQEIEKNGIPVSRDSADAASGSGVYVSAVLKDFGPGGLVETGRQLDLAIHGEGFFKVLLPDGGEMYTRDGALGLNVDGNLVTQAGFLLEGIEPVSGQERLTVAPDGTVRFEGAEGIADAGQITLYRFANPNGLRAEGGNLYSYDGDAGEITSGTPGSDGFGEIRQGFLEAANVDLVEEMAGLIEAQRSYGFNARVVRTADDMWNMANNLRK
ncbi:MAG TPA: flagellar hook-basal body complex protein [Bacillota bacterium]|nr:flagellar hook-basal body complex protein [Bacillota bacterium]